MKSSYYRIQNETIHVRETDNYKQTTLVLIHGLGVSSRYWLRLCKVLVQDYNLFAPDLPGFGKSTKPNPALTLAEQADTLYALLAQAGRRDMVLVGNSYGCQVIARLLSTYEIPEIHKVVLIGPTVNPQEKSYLKQAWRLLQNIKYEPLSGLAILLLDYAQAGPRNILQASRHALKDQLITRAHAIKQPTLVLRGRVDPIVPRHWAKAVSDAFEDSRYQETGTGHITHLNAPKRTASAIRAFIHEKPSP